MTLSVWRGLMPPSPPVIIPRIFLLGGRLFSQPGVIFRLCFNRKETAHTVVPEAAELGAGNLRFTGLVRLELDGDTHAGNGILLHPHDRQTEAVNHIFG